MVWSLLTSAAKQDCSSEKVQKAYHSQRTVSQFTFTETLDWEEHSNDSVHSDEMSVNSMSTSDHANLPGEGMLNNEGHMGLETAPI